MHFRRFILCVLLVLLPLRGWAVSDMQVSMALGTVTGAVTGTAVAATAAASTKHEAPAKQLHAAAPCHGEASQPDLDASPEPLGGSHAACTLCDLCHSVAMACAEPGLSGLPVAANPSFSLVSTDTGHLLIARLDRPPRNALPV
jgi:hypothetical protein